MIIDIELNSWKYIYDIVQKIFDYTLDLCVARKPKQAEHLVEIAHGCYLVININLCNLIHNYCENDCVCGKCDYRKSINKTQSKIWIKNKLSQMYNVVFNLRQIHNVKSRAITKILDNINHIYKYVDKQKEQLGDTWFYK